jgi:hypothetical protein
MSQYSYLAQVEYGGGDYNSSTYSCSDAQDTTCTTESAPNTGFFASTDAVFATVGGALLIAIGIVGIVMVVISRTKRRKQSKEQ